MILTQLSFLEYKKLNTFLSREYSLEYAQDLIKIHKTILTSKKIKKNQTPSTRYHQYIDQVYLLNIDHHFKSNEKLNETFRAIEWKRRK